MRTTVVLLALSVGFSALPWVEAAQAERDPPARPWAQPVATLAERPDAAARPTFHLKTAGAVLLAERRVVFSPVGGEATAQSVIPIDSEDFSDEDVGDFSDEDVEAFIDEETAPDDNDPLEPINRPIFEVNLALDRWVLRPITRVYIETVPEPGRSGIANALNNIKSPVIFANDLLQGELSRAGATFGRFFINTVFGLGGLIDTAEYLGLPGHNEDFGQTLATYGVGGSPYLVLPLLGPSNPRDAVGRGADILLDPLTYIAPTEVGMVRTGTGLVSDRAAILNETETLEETSIDFYAAVRSFYYQNRDFEISNESNGNGAPAAAPEGPTDGEDPFEALEEDPFDALEEE